MAPLVWLITGCSSGLGAHFIPTILARGDKVIATARDISKLTHLNRHPGVSILQLDVTSPQSSIQNTTDQAITIHGHIDVLINNAGFIQIGTVEELAYEDWQRQFDTNVFGTTKVTKALLPHFRDRHFGTLVFISSLSGWIGHEACGAYAGSKFALEGIAEALHRETKSLGIRTMLVEPGRFRTKLLSSGNMQATPTSGIAEYKDMLEEKMEGLAREDQRQPGDPEKLVSVVVDVVGGEGVAEGKEMPFRLPLGADCFGDMKAKCEETLGVLQEWEVISKSTDFDA